VSIIKIKKTIFLVLALAIVLGLTGCFAHEVVPKAPERSEDAFVIFRTDLTVSRLAWEEKTLPTGEDRLATVRNVLDLLEEAPEDKTLKKLKPDDIKVKGSYFGIDGQLIINFSSEYHSLGTVNELFMRAGYVKTLCQLEGVNFVEFYVEGKPLVLRRETVPGQMKSSDFIEDAHTGSGLGQEVTLTLYFADTTQNLLATERVKASLGTTDSYEALVLKLLQNGPYGTDDFLKAVVPEETVVNKVSSRDGIVYIDLNEKFLNFIPEVGEELTVYALVNSLCDLQGNNKVKITINGETRKTIEKYAEGGFLERKPELIISEKAGEANSDN